MLNLSRHPFFLLSLIFFCFTIIKPVNAKDNFFINNEEVNFLNIEILDIDKAYIIALSNNPNLSVFISRLEQAKQKIIQAKSYYWPQISFESAITTKNNLSLNNNDVLNFYAVELKSSWIIFDGFKNKFKNIIANYGKDIAFEDVENARRLLFSIIFKVFNEAQLSKERIDIALADEKFNERQLKQAKLRHKIGNASLSEIFNFEIKLNNAKIIRTKEETNYKVVMLNLASLLGFSEHELITNIKLAPFIEETKEELIVPNYDKLIKNAIKQRPDINMFNLLVRQAEAYVGIAKADLYPKIVISTKAFTNTEMDMIFSNNDISYSAQLGVSYNFFNGGLHTARINEAKNREIEFKNKANNALIALKTEIKTSILKIRTAQNNLISQRKNYRLTRQTRDLVEKEYNSKRVSLVRLNEIQNELIKASGQLVLAISQLRQAWMELRVATGEKMY